MLEVCGSVKNEQAQNLALSSTGEGVDVTQERLYGIKSARTLSERAGGCMLGRPILKVLHKIVT